MKIQGLILSLACLTLTINADPLLQWFSDNASGGIGDVVDDAGATVPVNSDWLVELIDDDNEKCCRATNCNHRDDENND